MDGRDEGSLTAQQARAVRTRGASLVLSSGAGCGKTHVLTERYLSHLREDGAEVSQVVAITFTDRAARQMRARIRRALSAHLHSAPTDAEADTWARHLRALESAPISTIHSFCGALLRQHAVEAGLDPRFEVLEDVLSANLEGESCSDALQKLLTAQTDAGDDLRRLVLLYGWRTTAEGVAHLARAWDAPARERWLATPPEEIAAEWTRYARAELLPRYVGHLLAARPALAGCLDLLRRHPPLPGPMADGADYLLRELPRLAQAPDLGAAVKALVESAKVGRAGAKAWPDPAVYEQIKKAFEDFRAELRGLGLEAFATSPEDVAEEVRTGRRFLRVAAEVVRAYSERKQAHGVVDFHDLLVRARDLLRDHPAVRARLQERYRFLLIDELQDTDPVQMELVEHLCGAGLTAGKLFAVGDYQQSIYSFRGADVSLFQALRRRVPHDGRQALSVNFRSQPALLGFTNALLGKALAEYEPLQAYEPQVNPGPCVEFLWAPRPEDASANEARSAEGEWLARRIAGMVGRECLAVDREGGGGLRPVRAGDVVLLFRAMSNVHLYESALRRHGLDYYLVGGRAFFAQQEVYDLLNLLRALENPQDGVSLAGTLRSPLCCLSDEALFVLARHPEGLWAGLCDSSLENDLPAGQRERVARARSNLARWRARKDRLPIARLLGEVFADSGYDAALVPEFLGERKLANLWKLVDLARAFDASGLCGLAEFIARLADLVARQPREEQAATQPENADVVRLMTVHQAKGLEFPVVFVPDVLATPGGTASPAAQWDPALGCVPRPPADEEPPPFPGFGWRLWKARAALAEWHEELRTLYVACTRARDYLVLSSALPESFRPAGAWAQTLASTFDLATGRCLAADVPEDHIPRVRVHDRDRPPPAPPPREGEAAAACATAVPAVRASAHPIAAVRGTRAVPVEELEAWLRDRQTLFAAAERPDGEATPEERAVRAVLARWDFRDAEGWRAPLAGAGASPRAERVLREFARSGLRRRLAQGRAFRREVEFLFEPGEGLPGVWGTVDCLWQDPGGAWHLLLCSAGAAGDREVTAVLAALALREQSGAFPASAAVLSLCDGRCVDRPLDRVPHGAVRARAAEGLRALAARGVR
jgi:ATP-dependent helicase/nuclease subunit A